MRLGDAFGRRPAMPAAAPAPVPEVPPRLATPAPETPPGDWAPHTCSWEEWLALRAWVTAEMMTRAKDALAGGRTSEVLAMLEQHLVALVAERAPKRDEYLAIVTDEVQQDLRSARIKATVTGRPKHYYSVYQKMIVRGRDFADIYDLVGVRVLVDTVRDCYAALGALHARWNPVPGRFKDYIAMPKFNMYQSLHTTVIGPDGKPVEVQIRTHQMHRRAEYGVAAHWKYKAGVQGQDKLEERLAWVRQLLESQRDSEDSGDLLRHIKSELLPEQVYVFTPKGDVIDLPSGATVIDFAYAIHSAVGNRMVGAKVNGRIVPIDHKVVTGEVIDVLTGSVDKGPSRDWLNIVTTSEARSKIRNWFKKERKEENITEGKTALDKELRRSLVSIPAGDYDELMETVARRQRMNSAEEMYGAIGYGGITIARLMPKIKEEYAKLVKAGDPAETFAIPPKPKQQKASEGVIVEGLGNVLIKFAKCCNPLPGDDIVGFITRGYGVSIHKRDCHNASEANTSPRWVEARWAEGVQESFTSTLEITALDRDRLFVDVSSLLADMRVPVYSLSARRTSDGKAAMNAMIGIRNTEHLNNVIARLRRIKDVVDITRS